MTTNDQDRLIQLELTFDNLVWLRAFLKEEISAAETDREKVVSLHTSLAVRAAEKTLEREHETMAKIHAAIDKTSTTGKIKLFFICILSLYIRLLKQHTEAHYSIT